MRHVFSILVLAAVLLVPNSRPDQGWDRRAATASDLAGIAPAASSGGTSAGWLLAPAGPDAGGADVGRGDQAYAPGLADLLRDAEARSWFLDRNGVWIGGVAGLALGFVVARRRRRDVPAAPDVPVVAAAPPPLAPQSRTLSNSLSQALAAVDLMEIEVHTALSQLGRTIDVLATDVTQSPLGAREPAVRAAEALSLVAAVKDQLAALRADLDDHWAGQIKAKAELSTTMERLQDVVRSAERMDAMFQGLIGTVEEIAGIPRLFDELEIRAQVGAAENGGPMADTIARARRIAMLRIDGLRRIAEDLTKVVVDVEERLVSLDEAATRLVAATPAADAGAAALDGCDGRIECLAGRLADLPGLLAPADEHAARLATQAGRARDLITQALGRLETILGNFVRTEERRRFQRVPAALPARVLIDDAWHDCNVVNLSLGGAAIDRELDCRAGAEGQLSFIGWDSLVPLVVTGTTPQRTHLCFRLNETLAKSLIGYLDVLQAA